MVRWMWLMAALAVLAPARADAPAQAPANRLAKETSPYLQLHAHNPVDWYPWGPEALAKAKAENKPIFLSIGYSACYWCHVMERECFQDAAIAKVLNASFVCIKVDREERPDIDQIYMTALQASGNGGGWPLSMFLTPDGRPFFGGTYFPPKDREGMPGFPRVLDGVATAWREERPAVNEAADSLTDVVKRSLASSAARRRMPLGRRMTVDGCERLADQFDPEFGGFGFEPGNARKPKFPEPPNLVFLLDEQRRRFAGPRALKALRTTDGRPAPEPLDMVLKTLDGMARGGIRDHLAGGYHRYSVDRSWTVPHFEKMLYDNAQLVRVHLAAHKATGDERWRREAEDTLAFVARSLTAPSGAFYSALDAETGDEEGAYYVWTRDDVRRALDDDDSMRVFAAVYGLDRPANFENGRYVLFERRSRKEAADSLGMTPEALEKSLVPLRAKLLAVRDARPAPRRDEKVLTAWSALMISAYADAARILKNEDYRKAAERAADFLLATHRTTDGRLLRTSRDGNAKLAAYLEDYAFLVEALLRLHTATGDPKRLEQAKGLADRMIADFSDKAGGGFYFTAEGHETLLARAKEPYDNALPSGNSVAVVALLDLARKTGEVRYRDEAGRALEAFSAVMGVTPASVPVMLVGLSEYLDQKPEADSKAAAPTVSDPLGLGANEVVAAEAAIAKDARPTAGGAIAATVTLKIKSGWHVYANPTGSETAKPTVVAVTGAKLKAADYPKGETKAPAAGGEKVAVYEGTVAIPLTIELPADAKAGPLSLTVGVRYQACNDRACLAPSTLSVPLIVEVGEGRRP